MMTVSATLQVRLLGHFQVAVGTQPVAENAWGQRRAAAILKLLALEPSHRLHREQIMDRLWPDFDPVRASGNLRFALHHARRQLEVAGAPCDTFVTRDGEMLVLGSPEQIWVDVDAFEQAVAAAWHGADLDQHRRALDLYTGDLLPEDLYEEWLESRRTALQASHLTLLTRLARLHEERAELGEAITTFQQMLTIEPTAEEGHVALMRLYARSGQMRRALGQYDELVRVLDRELDTTPEPASRELHDAIRDGYYPTAIEPQLAMPENAVNSEPGETRELPPTNLPNPIDALIGREREMAELRQLLSTARLVTLTGPGGIGKTRLGLAIAHQSRQIFPDGVIFVSLAPIRDPDLVVSAITAELGLSGESDQPPVVRLNTYLRQKRLLLVLDNFEQVAHAAAVIADLLEHSSHLKVLATSRVRLRLRGEQEYPIRPLTLPDPQHLSLSQPLIDYAAAALFIQRTREVNPDFQITDEHAAAVAQICCRLDGLPLAIELAAARTRVLTPQAILARLDRPLMLLTGGTRDMPERQQTIRNTIAWSYDLLEPADQQLFRELSVFLGGWTLEAAEAIATPNMAPSTDADRIFDIQVLDGLSSLMDANLVIQHVLSDGDARFGMLETIREFGLERLEEREHARETRLRHLMYFLDLTERAERELWGPALRQWTQRLEAEHSNLRAALSWAAGQHGEDATAGLRLAGALAWFWYLQGNQREGLNWLERLLPLTAGAPPAVYAKALTAAGDLAVAQGQLDHAVMRVEEGLAIWRELDDKQGIANALRVLAFEAHNRGDWERATARYEESLALYRMTDNVPGITRILTNLGRVACFQEHYDRASVLLDEAISLAAESGDTWGIAGSTAFLGEIARRRGDYHQATRHFQESLSLNAEVGNRRFYSECLRGLMRSVAQLGQHERAARLVGVEESLQEELGNPIGLMVPPEQRKYEHDVAALRAVLGAGLFEELRAQGRSMSLDGAIRYGLEDTF